MSRIEEAEVFALAAAAAVTDNLAEGDIFAMSVSLMKMDLRCYGRLISQAPIQCQAASTWGGGSVCYR
jgi:hypothetical protein